MKKAILLVQMGGPLNKGEMKTFLWRMFNDEHILPFPSFFRKLLATIITNSRYKKSWSKYELISGTPIISHTHKIANRLKKSLNNQIEVKAAFSYSMPDINHVMNQLKKQGIKEILVIPLYPHFSITTFQSVLDDAKMYAYQNELKLTTSACYYDDKTFIKNWADIIASEMQIQNIDEAHLLFSGHSIPVSFIKKGDSYPQQIEVTAGLIAKELNLKYSVSYQSQIKGQKWLGPQTDLKMKELKAQGIENLILVPISFINENLETLYDMDKVLVPYGENELGFKKVLRPKLPAYSDLLIELLQNLSEKFRNS